MMIFIQLANCWRDKQQSGKSSARQKLYSPAVDDQYFPANATTSCSENLVLGKEVRLFVPLFLSQQMD